MRFIKRCAALTALLAVAAMPVALAAERAAVTVSSGGVDFLPNVSYSSATLSVSGNGISFSRVIPHGGSLSISPFDLEGQLLPDGIYSWQLELAPNEATARGLRAAAAKNGGKAPEAWSAQSGTFAISGGSLADPGFIEAVPARPSSAGLTGAAFAQTLGGSASVSRGRAADDDAVVGNRSDAELRAGASAALAQPSALAPGLQQGDREGLEREDSSALALGASPETALHGGNAEQPTQFSRIVRPTSDGTNGRPRSK